MRNSLLAFSLLLARAPLSQTTDRADRWYEFPQHHPAVVTNSTNDFASLRAEVIANRLRVVLADPKPDKAAQIRLVASADAPGHWPTRDWQTIPMRVTASGWEASLPVEDLDVPIIYYVAADKAKTSPMRIVYPRNAGLDEPTRIFWAFVDGFEDNLNGWRTLDEEATLKSSNTAHMGKAALSILVSGGRRSATVATTRIRGWQVHRQRALGIRLWARKLQGEGRLRASLLANASTEKQVVSAFPTEPKLGVHWEKIDLLFAALPSFPLPDLDLVSFEFIGGGEYLIDDVELLGPWPSETH